jgi:hypothetical protein
VRPVVELAVGVRGSELDLVGGPGVHFMKQFRTFFRL